MFYRTIFVCLVGFVLAKPAEQDPLKVTFEITLTKVENGHKMFCDHSLNDIQQNIYTVREGETFKIITKYHSIINHLICHDINNNNDLYIHTKRAAHRNVTTFKVEKKMGTVWNCTVLAHRNNQNIHPVVQYDNAGYAAGYCFMKIHVRQTNSPQRILVNNMVLQAVRTDLWEKDLDFIAEYQYVDGDVVNVACVNYLNQGQLTMEYEMAGTMSDTSTMKELSSYNAIGFRAKLYSGHNNSHMICTNKDSTDHTRVMVRFVTRTEFNNIISIKINGLTLRPKLKNPINHFYEIEYKYVSNQPITVVCEVQRTDVMLVVVDTIDFAGKVSSYKMTEIIPGKKAEMSFYLKPKDDKKLQCSSDYLNGTIAEQVAIVFTEGTFPIDAFPLHMELPSDDTAMERYNDDKLTIIFYEFKDGETLNLTCGPLILRSDPGPVLYLQFKDSDICKTGGCTVSKNLRITRKDINKTIVCYLKEEHDPEERSEEDKVLKQIRVILRERVRTTTTTTTTTTPRHPINAEISPAGSYSGTSESGEKDDGKFPIEMLAVISGAVLCIIIICVATVIVKLRKRNHSQGVPRDRNYENLQTPSETSIPAYPPQWESNYAVPVDRRAEDATYSVPCHVEPALYSTPTPKNLRNKKQKPVDPRYAVLDIPNARGQKNTFKETDDLNYSEVYANRQEQCYGKVLPKSVRNKMVQDNNPYSYVTNEPAYANTAEPEPMYCEPAKAQGGTYANLNNDHYANSNAQEYVEPTYCEPQKPMK